MTIQEKLVACLRERGEHIAAAESCTGGLVAAGIVDVSGASEVLEESYITYSDRVKQKCLGVSAQTLSQYTAVSAQTAEEMAAGVQRATGAELTVSVTGYAGPDDAEDGTRAGTVYIGTWYRGTVKSRLFHFSGGRNDVRRQAAETAAACALERMQEIG